MLTATNELRESAPYRPSAFSAAEIRLEEFIDLDRYPIHDLGSPLRQQLVEQCREELQRLGCSHVANFVRSSAVEDMKQEAKRLMKYARPADDWINPYLTPDDHGLPKTHPIRHFEQRTSSFINSDLLEEQSLLRKFYDSDVVVHFVAECLNQGPIYRWADPLARNPYSVMKDGDYFPWHFDGNDFTVSILVQAAEQGGDFEYCPNLRNPYDERFEQVQSVLQGARDEVLTLSLRPGDLQLFKGRYSMHRVTNTRGIDPRIIALPTYVSNPFLVNRPYHAKAFYGRSLPIHKEREMRRLDELTD